MTSKGIKLSFLHLFRAILFVGMTILAWLTMKEYPGQDYIYILFTFISYLLLHFGFREKALFFDSFIGVFFWLGFWLKASVRIAFFNGVSSVPVGHFSGTGAEYDQVLLISTYAFLGVLFASWVRQKYLYNYPAKNDELSQLGLFAFYKRYRKIILVLFVLLFVSVAISNALLGIYQRGEITQTVLPYGLNGVYKWLLLFGLASISALLIKFEYSMAKKTSFLVAFIALLESFASNVSLLSRGMILNTSALVLGTYRALKHYEIKSNVRFLLICFVSFSILFISSVLTVNYLRASSVLEANNGTALQKKEVVSVVKNDSKALFIDRWVGLEGVMSVASYPEKGWELWRQAWQETYSENTTSFYDMNLIESPYKDTDKTKHHYISLPGIVAFLFYPGSYLFLMASMVVICLGAASIEIMVYKLGGRNVILCALLAQVMAYRFSSFGYVPAQSYLLFGTILLNVILIYLADKFLSIWYK